MKAKYILIPLFLAIAFSSIGIQQPASMPNEGLIYEVNKIQWVDSVANSLTLEQKVGQFFMAAIYTNKDQTHKDEIMSMVNDFDMGGLIFFQGDPVTQANWANDFQAAAQTPLFVSIDGEWGINMRLDNTIKYPRQLTLGAIEDEQLIYNFGKRVAEECKAVGVNINLAPVIDVNNNPNNPVINDRSFGEDKYNVALKGLAYIQGMQDQNVMAVGKHFPGHGDTDKDSHYTLPVINHDYERLRNLEMYPFEVAFENGLMGVMAAHLQIPALDDTENLAVSLSKKVTTDLLRDTLGFKGLVFSDALGMKGVADYYEPGEVDKVAFLAGNDILLFSLNIRKGHASILNAVESGEISEDYIDERLEKVLSYKYELGLSTTPDTLSTDSLVAYLNDKEGKTLQKELYEKAMTVVNNEDTILPLTLNNEVSVATLAIGKSSKTSFQKMLNPFREFTHYTAGNLTSSQASYMATTLGKFDKVVVGVYDMSRYSSKNYGFSQAELDLLNALNEKTEVVIVLFGSPYSLTHFGEFKNLVIAYEENELTQMAAANLILGSIGANGTIPVSAGGYEVGTGVELEPISILQYGIPEETGIDKKDLNGIDFYANKAINGKATPGCQILVAKDGKIIYHKSFGKPTYESGSSVKKTDIYDIASITKMSATTVSLMKLYDEGKFSLDSTVKDYLPHYSGKAIGNLNIKEILAHQSGLPAWIPFYMRSIKDTTDTNPWYSKVDTLPYTIQVADSLFIHEDSSDVVWEIIEDLKMNEKKYRYSDLGMYVMRQLVEKLSGEKFEDYTHNTFYETMGLNRTTFLPLEKFKYKEIIPTEEDTLFRQQVIHGHVHDPGAAMIGGVSGHAGLFSTALDQAAILQMMLNGGTYNNEDFFSQETIDLFTARAYTEDDNRRGIGFDKPVIDRDGGPTTEEVSLATYGHTGFTGTCAWADPEHDLVFVFLSNRIYPTAENKKLINTGVRTNIQRVIYNAMGIYYEIETEE